MKISIVGGGNAGCITALHYAFYTQDIDNLEIELIYNPDIPPEPVGQGTLLDVPKLLWLALRETWYHNSIHATFKSGILYEGWGKKNDKVFHEFGPQTMAMHYSPWEMQERILKSGWFKVREDGVLDVAEVDADYVFDARGTPKDLTDYNELINPLNACILGNPHWEVEKNPWSRHVATPDGWTFVIPSHPKSAARSGAVGYLYNKSITSKEDAEKNFLEMFDVDITGHLNFNNYMAKNPVIDNRIFLTGNRLFFVEPLESTATASYLYWARFTLDYLVNRKRTLSDICDSYKKYIDRVQNFVLWHYQYGSKYDTPFWKYAKSLKFKDPDFNIKLKEIRKTKEWAKIAIQDPVKTSYAQWPPYSFKVWDDAMNKVDNK